MTKVALQKLRLDGETQVRKSLNLEKVEEYAEAMKEGADFPAVTVFHDGSDYWLADGFHRYHAAKKAEQDEILADVKKGTVQEAQLFAFGANSTHGLAMTREERRDVAIRMIKHPLALDWPNTKIAKVVGLSSMTIGRLKASLEAPKETSKEAPPATAKAQTKPQEKPQERAEAPAQDAEREDRQEPPTAPHNKPQGDPEEDRIQELVRTIDELEIENARLKDIIATQQWDATDIEKEDVQQTLDDLRQKISTLEIDNAALRDSRDMFQARNAELMKTVKSLQTKLKKMDEKDEDN